MVSLINGLRGFAVQPSVDDWTHRQMERWDKGNPDTDRAMIVQPATDPGYAMPNASQGNLNQMPGVEVPGFIPVSLLNAAQDNTVPSPEYLAALNRVEPGPRANHMAEAHQAMNLTPQEQYLYNTHLNNLYGTGKIVHPDGAVSSLLQMSFEGPDGKTYNIPTVWGGRQLPPDAAIQEAMKTGLDKFPSYASGDEAEARYDAMHGFLEKDTADFIDRTPRQSR